MKKNNLYNIIVNTALIFKEWKNVFIFAISFAIFLFLFAFFYGLVTIPIAGAAFGFYRMVAPTSFEIFYMFFAVTVSALILSLTIYSTTLKIKAGIKGKSASAAGLVTGIFGAVCPACLGINLLAFGNVFTVQLSFLIPYIFWIQIGGIVFLTVGLYLVAKSTYEKKCISCEVGIISQVPKKETENNTNHKNLLLLVVAVLFIFTYQISTILYSPTSSSLSSGTTLVAKDGRTIYMNDVIAVVTPKAGFETKVQWGDIVSKMVKEGVLNPTKLENILVNRYGQKMKPRWRAILNGKNENLTINNDNAVFMMYVLWTFAKHNENPILTNSPFAKYFKNYDIGVGRAGYGDLPLLSLTPKQQALAESVAENANRPCCNNSTAAPDCSHGYSALGLVELMASQGFSKSQIFSTFVEFNSFWFPETYIKDALYFNVTKGEKWSEVNKELIAGKEYSSLSGSYKVKNYLKNNFGI